MRFEGDEVAGRDDDDQLVRINLQTGAFSFESGWPVSGSHRVFAGRLLRGGEVLRTGLAAAGCARLGTLLGGPGRVVRDLSDGAPLFTEPRLRDVTVATPGEWLTLSWNGRGEWFDPHTGTVRSPIALPLDDDETIDEGHLGEGGVVVNTSHHRSWCIQRQSVAPISYRRKPATAPAPLPEPLYELVEDWVLQGGVRWGWNQRGFLVKLV